ncbi:hypothetical protein LOK49_LG06G02314 [Camellia lanceoleosa]|uniref:Uncharacterized protein n=1 Tax=Camellia lanceoleosa TaxID=1840588 RepID=A0ACC0H8V8_9ERIC|nr:hypothetical protein LOK49_LG06G02314 [Camellia lanceoleosa]
MTHPSSSNFFFSTDGEFKISGVSFLPSDFDEGWREESMSDSDSDSDYDEFVGFVVCSRVRVQLSSIIEISNSTTQAIRFQLLQAPPSVINFSGDLKYATEAFDLSNKDKRSIENLQLQLAPRQVWMVSSIHRGEEEVMLGVHKLLKLVHPDVVTIIVPRHPQHGQEIALHYL